MRILIVTPYFFPENFRINDFAEEFQKRGHIISVLTSVPNYPKGKFFDGYGWCKKNTEKYKNIKIYRAPVIPRGSATNFRLSINYLSFIFGGIWKALFLMKYKYDIIFVFEPSPITVGLPAIFIKKIKRIPLCFWVLDLWPESVVSASNLQSTLIPKLLTPIVKYIYNNCNKILVSSKGFIKSIEEKGIRPSKIEYFPQWAEEYFKPVIPKKYLLGKIPRNSFKVMFAGNIGEAQDFNSLIKAAVLLKNENIQWIILGGGRKEKWVRKKIKEHRLLNCFHLLGSFPVERMPEFYAHADAMIFSLKNEHIFSITIPAKVQTYLACGKPILAMINGEGAKIIEGANAGLICHSGDFEGLANNILTMSSLSIEDLNNLSINSLECYRNNFDRGMLFKKAEEILLQTINSI